MTEAITIRFVSTVSRRGSKEFVVSIPKAEHGKAEILFGRKVKVVIEEIII